MGTGQKCVLGEWHKPPTGTGLTRSISQQRTHRRVSKDRLTGAMDGHAWHLLPCRRDEDLLCARRPALLKNTHNKQKHAIITWVFRWEFVFVISRSGRLSNGTCRTSTCSTETESGVSQAVALIHGKCLQQAHRKPCTNLQPWKKEEKKKPALNRG